jgi:hypothetical protein
MLELEMKGKASVASGFSMVAFQTNQIPTDVSRRNPFAILSREVEVHSENSLGTGGASTMESCYLSWATFEDDFSGRGAV